MATEIKIPKLAMSMTEGLLSQWLVADGAAVKEGDLIYALESEKSTQDVEATQSGKLKIIEKAGETYPVGQVIGLIE